MYLNIISVCHQVRSWCLLFTQYSEHPNNSLFKKSHLGCGSLNIFIAVVEDMKATAFLIARLLHSHQSHTKLSGFSFRLKANQVTALGRVSWSLKMWYKVIEFSKSEPTWIWIGGINYCFFLLLFIVGSEWRGWLVCAALFSLCSWNN